MTRRLAPPFDKCWRPSNPPRDHPQLYQSLRDPFVLQSPLPSVHRTPCAARRKRVRCGASHRTLAPGSETGSLPRPSLVPSPHPRTMACSPADDAPPVQLGIFPALRYASISLLAVVHAWLETLCLSHVALPPSLGVSAVPGSHEPRVAFTVFTWKLRGSCYCWQHTFWHGRCRIGAAQLLTPAYGYLCLCGGRDHRGMLSLFSGGNPVT